MIARIRAASPSGLKRPTRRHRMRHRQSGV